MIRLDKQPYCRCCGKPIPKVTDKRYFHNLNETPVGLDEVRAMTNQEIVHVRYVPETYHRDTHMPDGRRCVMNISTWDGETYKDDLFCTNDCAIALARSIVQKSNWAGKAYHDRMAKEG